MGSLAYLYNSLVIIWLLVSKSFIIKVKNSISIDLFINFLGILTGCLVRERLLTGRPELVRALLEALAKVNIVLGYVMSWNINLLYFFFIIFSLVISLLAYIWGL